MRAVIQRVTEAAVTVDGEPVGSIGRGVVVLAAIVDGDTSDDVAVMADKIVDLRIFGDDEGKMNRSIADTGGAALVISQFTLAGDVRRGRRPSFTAAADPRVAAGLIDELADAMRRRGVEVETGRFGAMMAVQLVNDGPVTFVIDVTNGSVQPTSR